MQTRPINLVKKITDLSAPEAGALSVPIAMINSTSIQQGTPSTAAIGLPQTNPVSRRAVNAGDSLSTEHAEMLKAKLSGQPEVRSDAVARGRALAADPNYPSMQIIGDVARKIVQSPDPSEELS